MQIQECVSILHNVEDRNRYQLIWLLESHKRSQSSLASFQTGQGKFFRWVLILYCQKNIIINGGDQTKNQI
jgi:hypothetical protein